MSEKDKVYKKCDICECTTDTEYDVVLFGDWMESQNIRVHYFCLLLSTNLAQRATDSGGILGFMLRDIRSEINAASKRICCFCSKTHASIACHTCKEYFHLSCAQRNNCLTQFCDEFRSYCPQCLVVDSHENLIKSKPPNLRCYICKDSMTAYNPITWIHSTCCNNGYVHRYCMLKYALAAGYYLICLWCTEKSFRDNIRLQGIFVPNREAQWEKQKNAYRDLHRGHNRCDMEKCLCPRGRDYITPKWAIITCSLCGSFGTHNPLCVPGHQKSKIRLTTFTCNTCSYTNRGPENKSNERKDKNKLMTFVDIIDQSVYMNKQISTFREPLLHETPTFSEEESLSSSSSMVTVIRKDSNFLRQNNLKSSFVVPPPAIVHDNTNEHVPTFIEIAEPVKVIELDSESQPLYTEDVICSKQTQNKFELFENTLQSSTPGEHQTEYFAATTQSPVVSSTSENSTENFASFDMWEFIETDAIGLQCLGSCTLRVNMMSPRFIGKTIEDIQNNPDLVKEEDIVERNANIGIFADIDRLIKKLDST